MNASGFRRAMLASITDPEHRREVQESLATMDRVRATTDRVRYSEIRRGDVIVSDDGTHYPVEKVRRTQTDIEFTLTGPLRTFVFRASRLDSANRLPRNPESE